MSAHPRLKVSEEEYLRTMTDEKPSLEFVNGEVFQKPVPQRPHNDVARWLNRLFVQYEARQGGYWTWEAHTNLSRGADRRYRVPDQAYWAPGREVGEEIYHPPTLAIEIRSKDQSMRELRDKCREYRSRDVFACWLIDPYRRTVEVFEDGREGEVLLPGAILESAHVPGMRIDIAEMFAFLDTRA